MPQFMPMMWELFFFMMINLLIMSIVIFFMVNESKSFMNNENKIKWIWKW